jgi:hypothetical protein
VESKEARDSAETAWRASDEVRRILSEAAAHAEIQCIGEFEEPEWIVLPG